MTPSRPHRLTVMALGLTLLLNSISTPPSRAQDEPPRSLDPRLKIELFAENPQLATPTGIDVDHAGRVWLIESNTHFPPEGYKGHPTDRVLVMEDSDTDGKGRDHKADKITVFKDGLTHTMSIAVKPVWLESRVLRDESREPDKTSQEPRVKSREPDKKDGKALPLALDSRHSTLDVFIATRREILLCTDTDGDLKCDETKRLVHLETTGNYPHNGLAGFAFDALGNMFFGFGENLGADYKIIGSDGTTLSGGGEGGNVYRCRPDGSELVRWATGFWNPHASCFDAFGRLFTLDNDPDSRPPCRLLHIIPGGDYGYRFRNGRKGTHPFTSWNGEIPGTLPMVSGTGEAPSGIVCYESDGFPENDYLGTLLVSSWGDHRIDKFVLKPRGASFESLPQPVIKGGENFRPVGLALAPDGSLYVTDWVLKDYKLHGKGRVWRVSAKEEPKREVIDVAMITPQVSEQKLARYLKSPRLDVRRASSTALKETWFGRSALKKVLAQRSATTRSRMEALWSVAFVPIDVENLQLKRSLPNVAPIAVAGDEVAVAAVALINNSPQFTMQFADLHDEYDGLSWFKAPRPGTISVDQRNRLELATRGLETSLYLALSNDIERLRHLPEATLQYEEPFNFAVNILDNSRYYSSADKLMDRMFESRPACFWSYVDEGSRQLSYLLAARQVDPKFRRMAEFGVKSEYLVMRRAAVQWVGEENLKELRPEVEKVLASEPMTGDLFMACLASLSMLDGVPPAEFEKAPPVQHILPIVKDAQRSASLRAIALRMLPPTLKELDGKLLGELVASTDEGLRREAVRTLGHSPISERDPLLRGIAADESLDANLRADAVAGLAPVDHHAKLNDATRDLLVKLLRDKNDPLVVEAVRSLRGAVMAKSDQAGNDAKVVAALKELAMELKIEEPGDSRPPLGETEEGLRPRLREAVAFALGKRFTEKPAVTQRPVPDLAAPDPSVPQPSTIDPQPLGDAAAGRRTFFHTNSVGCFKCHTVGGRGGQVGPDLTVIARTMDRQKLAESILEPSKEISPQFTTWAVETTNGKVLTGMLLGEEVNGDLRLGDNTGKVFFVPFNEIETRQPMKTSTMPDKLHEQLTPTEFRDLIAYLETLK